MREFDYPPFNPCLKHSKYSFWRFMECTPNFKQDVLSCKECIFSCGICKDLLIQWNQDTNDITPPFSESRNVQTNKDKLPQCLHCRTGRNKKSCSSKMARSTLCDLCQEKSVRCELFEFTNPNHRHLHKADGAALESSPTMPTQKDAESSSAVNNGKKRKVDAIDGHSPTQNQETAFDTQNKTGVPLGDSIFVETSNIGNSSEAKSSSSRIAGVYDNSQARESVLPQQATTDGAIRITVTDLLNILGPEAETPQPEANGSTMVEFIGQMPVAKKDDIQSHSEWMSVISGYRRARFPFLILSGSAKPSSICDLLSIIQRTMLSIRFFTQRYVSSDYDQSYIQIMSNSCIYASRIQKNTQLIYDAIQQNGTQDDGSNLAGLLLNRMSLRGEIDRGKAENVFDIRKMDDSGASYPLDMVEGIPKFIYLFLFCLIHIPIEGQESSEQLNNRPINNSTL